MVLLGEPGAFGSNLAVAGLDESDVTIGERFTLGSSLIEISQPRQPCWKIEHRFGIKGIVAKIIQTGRCGWYFRVLEPGQIAAGDQLERAEAGHDGWSVSRAFLTLFGPNASTRDLAELAALERLSADHKARALKRAG